MAGDITRKATIQFDADTSAAQARIQQLAQSLQSAINFGVQTSGITQIDMQLQNATKDAINLQSQLKAAVNVNTGKLDLTKFTQSLKQGNNSLQQYQRSLSQLGSNGQAAFANLARSIATAEAPMLRVSNILSQMGTTLKNTIKWNISASIINGFVGSIQSAFNYAEKLNESLNRIQIVTGESSAQMSKFAAEANKAAQTLSTTTRAYTDAALIFYQQGLGDADVKARTDAVIKMANVTGDASKEVSNYMTAIWNNFDDGISTLESFEDKIVSLGATTASSSAEIAAGLEKFAAVGSTIGLSFDYAAAALSTVVAETRQSADTVGTAFRTLFSRLQGLKLGETLDDGTTLNKYSAALATVGVQITDTSGQLKDMDTILSELASSWNTLTQAQKVALAQTVGGARQYTTLISLMENWEQFQKNLTTEMNSGGALNQQAETYAESWAAAKDRVTASLEEIYSTLIDDKFFIGLNNGIAKAVSGISDFIKGIGGISGVLSRIGALALTVFEDQISKSLSNLVTNIELLTTKGQEKMRALQTQTVDMMQQMGQGTTGGTSGIGQQVISDAYTREAQIQAEILKNAQNLNEIQQSSVTTLQKIVQARTDENAKLGKTIADTEDLYNKQQSGAAKTVTELNRMGKAINEAINFGNLDRNIFTEIKNHIKEINTAAEDKTVLRQYFDSFNSGETAAARLSALKEKMDELSGQGGPQATAAMNLLTGVFKKVESGAMDAEKAVSLASRILEDKMGKATQTASINIEQFNTKIDSVIDAARQLGNTNLASWLTVLKTQTNGSFQSFEDLQQALEKVTRNSKEAEQAIRLIKEILGEAQTQSMSLSTQMVKFGQVLTSFASIINQVKGLIEVWSDKSASLGKKLLTTVTAVGMLLPLLARMTTNLGLLIPGFAGVTTAAGATTVGMGAAATSITIFGTTIKLTFPVLAAITAAITLLVVGIISLVNWLKAANDEYTLKEQLEDITEAANETRTALEKLNTVISNLSSAKEEYDELRAALDGCKQGTTEWYEALEKVQAKGTEILTQFPIISKVLQNPSLYFGDDFNIADLYDSTTGTIDFSRILARVIERNEQYQDELILTEGFTTRAESRTAAQVKFNERRDATAVVPTDGTDQHTEQREAMWLSPFRTNGGFAQSSFDYDWEAILNGTQDVVEGSSILANSYRGLINEVYDTDSFVQEQNESAAEWARQLDSSQEFHHLDNILAQARLDAMDNLAAEFGHEYDYGGSYATGDPARFLNELTTSMMTYGVEHSLSDVNDIIDQYFAEPKHQALLPIYMAAVTGDERYFKATYAGIQQYATDNGISVSQIRYKPYGATLGTLAQTGYTGEYSSAGPLWDPAQYALMQGDYATLTEAEQYDYTALMNAATHVISRRDDLSTGEATFARQALPRALVSEDSELLSRFDNVDFSSEDYLAKVQPYLEWLETVDTAFQGYDLSDFEIVGNMIRLTKGEGDNQETYELSAYRPLVHDLTESVGDEMVDTVVEQYRSWAPEIQAIATANGYKELTKQEYDAIMADNGRAEQFGQAASALGWQQTQYEAEFDNSRYRDIGEGTGTWLSTITNRQNELIEAYDSDLAERMWTVLEAAEDVSTYFTETGDLNFAAFEEIGAEAQARSRDTQSFIDLAASWESVTAILDKLNQGKAITEEELAQLEELIGPVSNYFELTSEGFALIDGQMGNLSAQALSQMSIIDNSIQKLQTNPLDFNTDSWKDYIDLLEMLGYSATTIQSYIDNNDTVALERVQDKVDTLLDADLSAYEVDDQFVYKLLSYADSITEVSQILDAWNLSWGDINQTTQKAILKQLGITDTAIVDNLVGKVDFSQVTAAFSSQDTITALNNFITGYSSYITDDIKEQLDTQPDAVLNQSTKLKDLKQKIADMLGVSVDLITNDWLRTNWSNLTNLGSGDYAIVETSLHNLVNSFNRDVVPTIITGGIEDEAAYLTGNLITKAQQDAKGSISRGIATLNTIRDNLLDETFQNQIEELTAAELQAEAEDANSVIGPKIVQIRQMIADLLGVDLDQISYELIKQWSDNGILAQLTSGSTSTAALSTIIGDVEAAQGITINTTDQATRLLSILGPQGESTTIGAGIGGLQSRAGSLRSGNLYNFLNADNLTYDATGAFDTATQDYYSNYIEEFKQLKTALAALLELDVDQITDQQIANWFTSGTLGKLISGHDTAASTAYGTMYAETHNGAISSKTTDIGTALAVSITPDQIADLTSANTQAVVDAFASRDFTNVTKGRLQKAIQEFATLNADEIITSGNETLINAGLIEKQWNEATQQYEYVVTEAARTMGYQSVAELIEGLQSGAQSAFDSLDLTTIATKLGGTLGPAVQEALSTMDEHGILTAADITNVTTTLKNAQDKTGVVGFSLVSNILNQAGDNAGYLAGKLANIDWKTVDVDTLTTTLNACGIDVDNLGFSLDYLIAMMQSATTYTNELATALSNYTTNKDIASKIKSGGTLTDAEMSQYISQIATTKFDGNMAQAYQYASENFVRGVDGWTVDLNVDAQSLGDEFTQSIADGFGIAVDQAAAANETANTNTQMGYYWYQQRANTGHDDMWGMLNSSLPTLRPDLTTDQLTSIEGNIAILQNDETSWGDYQRAMNAIMETLDLDFNGLLAFIRGITSRALEEAQEVQSSAEEVIGSLETADTGLNNLTTTYTTTKSGNTAIGLATRASTQGRSGMTTADKTSTDNLYNILSSILGIQVTDDNFMEYQQIAMNLMSGQSDLVASAFSDINTIREAAGLDPFAEDAVNGWTTTLCSLYRESAEQELQTAITDAITGNFSGKSRSEIAAAREAYEGATTEQLETSYISAGYIEDVGGTLNLTDAGKAILGEDFTGDIIEGLNNAVGTGLEDAEHAFAAENVFANYADLLADGTENKAKQMAMALWTAMADVTGSEIKDTDASKFMSIAEKAIAAGVTDISELTTWLSTVPDTIGAEYMDEILAVLQNVDWSNFDANQFYSDLAAAGVNVNELPEGFKNWVAGLAQGQTSAYVKAAVSDFASDGKIDQQSTRELERTKSDLTTAEGDWNRDAIRQMLTAQGLIDDSENGLSMTGEALGYADADALIEGFIQGMEDASADLDSSQYAMRLRKSLRGPFEAMMDLYTGFNEAGEEVSDYKNTDLSAVSSLMNKMFESGGTQAARMVSDMARHLKDTTNKSMRDIVSDLSSIDWSQGVDSARLQLQALGYDADDLGISLESLCSVMQVATNKTYALTDALNDYANSTNAADNLRAGKGLTKEQYAEMVATYGEDQAREMMYRDRNGEYHLNEGYDRETTATGLEAHAVEGYRTVEATSGAVLSDINAGYLNGNWTSLDRGWLDYAQDHQSELADRGFTMTDDQWGLVGRAAQEGSDVAGIMGQGDFANIDWSAFNEAMQAIARQENEEAGEMALDAERQIPRDNARTEWQNLGLNVDEVDELGDSIQGLATKSEELADTLEWDADAADEVAKELKRYDKAVTSVTKNYDDWMDALESDNIEDQSKAIGEIDTAMSDMLDIDVGSLSKDFLTNAENLDLMKQAADGSTDAYNELAARAEDDLLIQAGVDVNDTEAWNKINSLQDTVHAGIDDIEVGAYIDDAQAIQAMNELINMAGMTAEQATNYLASMGVDAEVETVEVPQEKKQEFISAIPDVSYESVSVPTIIPGFGSLGSTDVQVPTIKYSPQTESENAEGTEMATALRVTSAKKSSGGNFKQNNSSAGGGRRGGGGCFEAGTLITTYNGYKKIEDIQIGDIVLSYNEKSQRNEYSQVLETMIHVVVDNIYTLHIKDDNLVVTGIHRFYVKRMGRTMWIAAANLHINDIVLFADGTWHLIEAIDIEYKSAVVYNFEVSGNHNYYVGKNRILAHNKGGGGGGGRRQDQTGDRKKKENRYVTNTNQLEDIQDKLDKINKAEGRSYGRNRLKQMQDKAKVLKELAAKQKDLYDEAVAYQKADRDALTSNDLAKKMGIKFEFDENGTILNRDDIEQKMVDFYNSYTEGKDDKGNWILKKNTEAGAKEFKEMQEAWDELNEQLDKYDESQDKVKEYWQAHLDAINEAYDVIVEMANYKVEVQVEVSDEALNLLDHMLGKIEDDAYKAAEAIAYMGEQMFEYQAQDAINTAGIRDILAHHDGESQYADDEGNLHTTSNIGAELKAAGLSVNDLMSGNSDAWDILMSKEKEFTQDELDSLQDMINAKLEATEKMMETQKEVYEQISNVFDKGTEDMDRIINKMDHLQSITESYSNIVDLVGRKRLGITNDMMDEFEMSGVEQSLAKLRATRTEMETQKTMLSDLQNQFKNGRNQLSDEQRAAFAEQAEQVRESTKGSREELAANEKKLKQLQKEKDLHKSTTELDLAEAKARKAALTAEYEATKKREEEEAAAQKKADEAAKKQGKRGGGGGRSRNSTEKSAADIKKELDSLNNQIKKLNANEETYAKKQQASIDALQTRIDEEKDNVTLMEEKLELYDQLAHSDSVELTERDLELLSDQMEHMEDAIQESTETFYSSWEEAITKISELYTNMMTRAIEDASDKLAGEMGSLAELADAFSKKQEENELYVEDFRKIYELSKLNRDIVNSIDETQNVKAKQRLVEYQAELNQLEKDREKMSEYEIENARRRYELLLAELALEESKNAKSQVQMTRNDSGEWSYVYTADESEVEKAEQDYEDKLYAMQRANADYINELQSNIVDMEQAMMDEIESIRVEDYANREEYENAIRAIYDHYGVMMDGYMDQMGIVFGENQRLYTEDWAIYSEMTGYKISEDEEYIDKWNETTLGKKTGFDTMEDFHQNFNDVSQELFDENMNAYDTWESYIEDAMVDAGTATDDFAYKMNEDVGEMTQQADQLADTMNKTSETVVEAFDQMTEALSNWQAEYSKSIEEMLEKNEALAKSFNNLLKEWSGYNETTGQDPTTGSGDNDDGDDGGGTEDPGQPATQGEQEEPESAKEKTKRLKKGVAAAVWGYPGGAGWGHGNSSRKLTSGDRYRRFKEKGLIPDEVQQQINRYSKYRDGRHGGRSGMMKDAGVSWKDYKKYTYKGWGFDTGGYTGDWEGGDGRLAILHSKEIVLNQDDTKNFLAGIEILRDITKTIDINAMANAGYMANIARIGGVNAGQLQQQVTITAEFPNATDKDSIKEAFNDLINLASQYANRK